MPPMGVKLNLLTVGGIAVTGNWSWYGGYVGWQYLFKRDIEQEMEAKEYINQGEW